MHRLDITRNRYSFFPYGRRGRIPPRSAASYYRDGAVRQRARETGRKKRTREELWRRSVPGSDLSARGTCHARNAKREHHAAVIAEKSLSSSNLKFRGQRESTYGVTRLAHPEYGRDRLDWQFRIPRTDTFYSSFPLCNSVKLFRGCYLHRRPSA